MHSTPPRAAPRLHAAWLAAAAALAGQALPVQAQVYGSLANFDAVNDTGQTAHGFEIRIEDASFHRSSLVSVFGLDRDFGVPPSSVQRYGAPTITELPGVGVTIRYAASFAAGAWSAGTPSGPYPNAGDSCWPLGNPLYAGGSLSCDHFGAGTYGTPAAVRYAWLVDAGGNSGQLTPVAAAIPAVAFAYSPPPPGPLPAARPVVAEIEAPRAENEVFGTPFWVRMHVRKLDHGVEVQNLMRGAPDVPEDAAEVESEWEIFQAGEANGRKRLDLALAPGEAALVVRYEFYRYQGALDPSGEALCGRRNHGGGGGAPEDCGGLGAYVGAQMAGFNAVQPPALAVPEPQTAALWAAGLLGLGWLRRRGGAPARPGAAGR